MRGVAGHDPAGALMADTLVIFDEMEPEAGAPDPAKVVSGSPRFRTWNHYADGNEKTFAGVWEATPGAWRISYDEWEFCHIIAGVSILTRDGGMPHRLSAGDCFVIEPGFTGIWEVVETTTKHYVIRLP